MFELTDFDVYHSQKGDWISLNFGISDKYLLQYDTKTGFSIPSSDEAFWNDEHCQDDFLEEQSANHIAKLLKLEKISKIADKIISKKILTWNNRENHEQIIKDFFHKNDQYPRCVF